MADLSRMKNAVSNLVSQAIYDRTKNQKHGAELCAVGAWLLGRKFSHLPLPLICFLKMATRFGVLSQITEWRWLSVSNGYEYLRQLPSLPWAVAASQTRMGAFYE
ncbi:hypothetical protein [Selenomonas sp. AB3002]|uniref:hypothetical protein n=1 Tax=Selenomonas sp. AB3002 TaxID=1392502 RepID=UPI0004973600